MPSLSIRKGRGSLSHNDRTIKNRTDEKSWDESLSHLNIKYRDESLKDAYDHLFSDSLERYNQKQIDSGHSERQIKDYLYHVNHSKQEKAFYELIIEIGNIDDKNGPEYVQIQKALDQYNKGFQERNPNMYVFKQITHRDEKGMDHTHIDFIPYTTGSKRGLDTRNTLGGALKEMGYGRNGFSEWVEKEKEALKEIMRENGLKPRVMHSQHEYMTSKEYSMMQQAISKEAKKKMEEIKVPDVEVKTNPITKKRTVTMQENEYKALCEHYELQIQDLRAKNDVLVYELDVKKGQLKKKASRPVSVENDKLKENVAQLTNRCNILVKENDSLKVKNKVLRAKNVDLESKLDDMKWYKRFYEKVIKLFSRYKDRGQSMIENLDLDRKEKYFIADEVDSLIKSRARSRSRGMER